MITSGQGQAGERPLLSEDEIWRVFAAADTPQAFHAAWLALLGRRIPNICVALLLVAREDGSYAPAAIWPDTLRDATHLGAVAEKAIRSGEGVVQAGSGEGAGTPRQVEIAYPIAGPSGLAAVVVVEVAPSSTEALRRSLRELHWAAAWIGRASADTRLARAEARVAEVNGALDLMAATAEVERFDALAMSLANELSARFAAHRVTLATVRPRGGHKVVAMSQAATFDRQAGLVDAVGTAMAEAQHQGRMVAWPPGEGARRGVAVAHRRLCEGWGSASAVTLPVVSQGRIIGLATLERPAEAALFDEAEIGRIALALDLVAPLMASRQSEHRWFSGRLRQGIVTTLRRLAGPRHMLLKAGVLAGVLAGLFLAFATGPFRVTAKASLEGAILRAAVAPFDGFVREAPVRAGDVVEAGALLARLEDRDLRFERLKWRSELQKLEQRQRDAMAKADRVNIGVIDAQIAQAQAELSLVEEKLARTQILAPLGGLVVTGDLSQLLGTPVETGKVLFEIAPLTSYRVVLQVLDHDIAHVRPGQSGTLTLTGAAEGALPLTVERVTSVSGPKDGVNQFRVEARLAGGSEAQLRPGMEGVAKIAVDERRLAWIWSRGLLDRLRLFLWNWMP
jgi:hypothetical protein